MKLSVIIVNYNVKYFLEKCLTSVAKAAAELEVEVIVVDNASTDNSLEYLTPKFPSVRFISNKDNTGFGKANNQGLAEASGDYLLFLNPDTILPEHALTKCISFMDEHPEAGACGVRMIDGSGHFLPESKRGFPSLRTAFFKLSGITARFPHSKTFARYYLGHLPENETNVVDVLAGAYLIVRREVLEKTGAFDEAFFMYGEDVDLSYRIQKAGWKNYYYTGTTIIHFKGESTKKGNLDYVHMFYKAMSIFVNKHYGGKGSGWFLFCIQLAIRLRAVPTAIGTLFKSKPVLPSPGLLDTVVIADQEKAQQLISILAKVKPARRIKVTKEIPAAEALTETNEIIFCENHLPYHQIIHAIESLPRHLSFRFYDPHTNVIIGSDSKNKSGIVIV
jgi:GT2 family glycosyltransferase